MEGRDCLYRKSMISQCSLLHVNGDVWHVCSYSLVAASIPSASSLQVLRCREVLKVFVIGSDDTHVSLGVQLPLLFLRSL